MAVSSYVGISLPLSDVGVRWEPNKIARIFEVATLRQTAGRSEASFMYKLILKNHILSPLALISEFAVVEVPFVMNAISGEGEDEHAPNSVSSKACSCRLTKTWS